MSIEVQSVVFCDSVVERPEGGFDLRQAPITEIQLNPFPATIELNYFLLLRKEAADVAQSISVELRVHDQDGRTVHGPETSRTEFGGGCRFAVVVGAIQPTFAKPDAYSIRIRIAADGRTSDHRYDVDVFKGE